MRVQNEVEVQSILKGSAAKVLLHLLAHHGETMSNADIMRGAGVNDRNTYFAAKKQLVELRLWENPYAVLGITPTVGGNTQTVGGITPTVGGNTPTPVELLDEPGGTAYLVPAAPPSSSSLPTADQDWLAQAVEADRMDDSGDRLRATSPFGVRRAAQIRVLCDAYAAMFCRPLVENAARRWLVLTDNFAEDALAAIEEAFTRKGAQMAYPNGYIERILKNRRAEAAQRPGPGQGQGPTGVRPAEEEDNYYLKENTAHTKELKAKIAKLLALGVIKPENPDD